jgi:hypothetical protein
VDERKPCPLSEVHRSVRIPGTQYDGQSTLHRWGLRGTFEGSEHTP